MSLALLQSRNGTFPKHGYFRYPLRADSTATAQNARLLPEPIRPFHAIPASHVAVCKVNHPCGNVQRALRFLQRIAFVSNSKSEYLLFDNLFRRNVELRGVCCSGTSLLQQAEWVIFDHGIGLTFPAWVFYLTSKIPHWADSLPNALHTA